MPQLEKKEWLASAILFSLCPAWMTMWFKLLYTIIPSEIFGKVCQTYAHGVGYIISQIVTIHIAVRLKISFTTSKWTYKFIGSNIDYIASVFIYVIFPINPECLDACCPVVFYGLTIIVTLSLEISSPS